MRDNATPSLLSAGARTAGGHRPALDGLRALAVLGVIGYHLHLAPVGGGFLGVDLFFVLSGYLITGILVDERIRTGAISVANFWARRVRRLYPALVAVVLVVLAKSATTSDAAQHYAERHDVIAALFYFANWHFAHSDQSYFAQFNSPSPVLHTWSLSIEEQFYLVWPLLVILFIRLAKGRTRLLAVAAAVGVVVSVVVMAALYQPADPSAAYYSTVGRIHELFVGAILALVVRRRPAPHDAAPWLGAVALLAVLGAFVLVDDTGAYYYRGGSLLFCVIAAALIFAVESSRDTRVRSLLSRQPLPYLGRISYGLYLWHWPVIVWLTAERLPLSEAPLDVVRVAVTFALAVASWHLLESPIQRGRLRLWLTPRRLAVIVPAVSLFTVAATFAATRGAAPAQPTGFQISAVAPAGTNARDAPRGTPTIGLVGDSVAAKLWPAFAGTAKARGWVLASAAAPGCPVARTVQTRPNGRIVPWQWFCKKFVWPNDGLLIARYDPDVVLWYSGTENTPRLESHRVALPGSATYTRALRRSLLAAHRDLTSRGAELVIVEIPPHGPISDCHDTGLGNPCELTRVFDRGVDSVNAQMTWLTRRYPEDTRMLSINDLLQCRGGTCPRAVNGVVVRPDGAHFGPQYARKVADTLLDRIARDARAAAAR